MLKYTQILQNVGNYEINLKRSPHMKLNLSAICECLPDHIHPIKQIETNKSRLYDFPKIYNKNMNIEENTLYITESSSLPKTLHSFNNVSIICIGEHSFLGSTNCSILQLDSSTSILEVYTNVVEIFQKYNNWENEITKIVMYKGNLKDAINTSLPLFEGNQLNCTNLIGELIAGEIHLNGLDHATLANYNSKQMPLTLIAQNIDQLKPEKRKGVVCHKISSAYPRQYHCLQRELFIKDECIAIVNCVDIHHPLREIEYLLVNKLCDILEEALQEGCVWNYEAVIKIRNSFQALLNKEIISRNKLISHLSEYNIIEPYHFTCFVIRLSDTDSSIIMLKFLAAHIGYYLQNAFVTSKNSDIVIYIHTKDTNNLHNMIENFQKILIGCSYKIGISNTFDDLENALFYYLQASTAIDLGSNEKEGTPVHFANYVIPYILNKATETIPVQQLCHPGILLLYKADKESNSNYIETLNKYFKNNQNAIKTSEELFIHRSTLLYRLDKIRAIIKDDWNTCDKQLHIMLSLKMIQMID